MKKIILFTILGLSLAFIVSCGLTGGGNNLAIKADGLETTITGSNSYVSLSTVSPKGAGFRIANFEPQDVKGKSIAFGNPKAEGQVLLEFSIQGKEIKPGEYVYGAAPVDGRLGNVTVSYYTQDQGSKGVSVKDGKVNITAVSDETISGTITADDGSQSVKGDFSAKILK